MQQSAAGGPAPAISRWQVTPLLPAASRLFNVVSFAQQQAPPAQQVTLPVSHIIDSFFVSQVPPPWQVHQLINQEMVQLRDLLLRC